MDQFRFKIGLGFLKPGSVERWRYSFIPASGHPLSHDDDAIVRLWCKEQWGLEGWVFTEWMSCVSTDDFDKATEFRLRWC